MLYTKKGDNGTTKLFDCPPGTRIKKCSLVFDVLGTLDELNSSLGYAKALASTNKLFLGIKNEKMSYTEILETIQQNLFCIQAEIGGATMAITRKQVSFIEEVIFEIETLLPPITSFIVSGGGETGAYLDVVRTVARRAERAVVLLREGGERGITDTSLEFMNRLSSVLYALARFANYQQGFTEKRPSY